MGYLSSSSIKFSSFIQSFIEILQCTKLSVLGNPETGTNHTGLIAPPGAPRMNTERQNKSHLALQKLCKLHNLQREMQRKMFWIASWSISNNFQCRHQCSDNSVYNTLSICYYGILLFAVVVVVHPCFILIVKSANLIM